MENPFMTITLRSILTWSGSTCQGPFYGSDRTVQSFTKDITISHCLVGRVFANGPEDLRSIPYCVIPKTLKMILDTSLLNTQHYKARMKSKVEQPVR